jgi:hypothetical protein
VISGNHSPAFEAVCDALAASLQARHAHLTGAGHATPETGDAFNETLKAFIRTACLPSHPRPGTTAGPARSPKPPWASGGPPACRSRQPRTSGRHNRPAAGRPSRPPSAGSPPPARRRTSPAPITAIASGPGLPRRAAGLRAQPQIRIDHIA